MIIIFLLYIIAFIGIYFNSYTFPNLNNESKIMFLVLLTLLILDQISFNVYEHFSSNEAAENINSVFNKDTIIIKNLNIPGNLTCSGNLTVNGTSTITGYTNFANGGKFNIKGPEGPGLLIKGPKGSYLNFYEKYTNPVPEERGLYNIITKQAVPGYYSVNNPDFSTI